MSIIRFFLGFFFLGLLVHVAVGNDSEVVRTDATAAVVIMLGTGLLYLGSLTAWLTVQAISHPHIYRQNEQATMLVKKYHRGTLTGDERRQFEMFRNNRTIMPDSNGRIRLSDEAILRMFR